MADLRKTIKILENYEPYARRFHGITVEGSVILDALELLNEQEAEPVFEGKVNECTCGHEINRYWHPKFCGFCGKELIWY